MIVCIRHALGRCVTVLSVLSALFSVLSAVDDLEVCHDIYRSDVELRELY